MTEDFSSLIFITFFFLILLFKITIHFIKSKEKKGLNLPPGSYGWPFLGETLEFFRRSLEGRPEKFIKDRMEKYKSHVLKTSLLGENVAILCGPAGNKFLFSNSNKLVTTWWPKSVKKLLGPCITTIGSNEGMQMRKMVLYFFSPDAFIKLYSKSMNLITHQHIKTHWQGKEVVNVHQTIRIFTFEVVCRVLTSIEDEKRIEKLGTLFNIFVRGVISVPINLPGTRFYKAKRAIIALKKDLSSLVRERR
ncbi:Cytochrome [Forsythia ovata]|uniref:Cytochrome n=1 Tax=Forsythia ovata TaxID=205694 RepID=A0ABD1RKX2_9LAMI